jgi:argininosuccinate synthase
MPDLIPIHAQNLAHRLVVAPIRAQRHNARAAHQSKLRALGLGYQEQARARYFVSLNGWSNSHIAQSLAQLLTAGPHHLLSYIEFATLL